MNSCRHVHFFPTITIILLAPPPECLNTRSLKRSELRIYTNPNGSKSQLVYVFVNMNWINSALNCEANSLLIFWRSIFLSQNRQGKRWVCADIRKKQLKLHKRVTKLHNAQLLNRILPKSLRKNQNGFRRIHSITSQILTSWNHWRSQAKNLGETLLFIDFSKVFNSTQIRKILQMQRAYGRPKKLLLQPTQMI